MQLSQCQQPLLLTDLNTVKVILTLSLGNQRHYKVSVLLTAKIVLPPQNKITVIKKNSENCKSPAKTFSTRSKTSYYKLTST